MACVDGVPLALTKDGTYPMDLVKDHEGLKVHQWLSNYIKEQVI